MLIKGKCEGEYWDFKQEWHKDNERLLHDILCFANTVHHQDCYIIVGVSDTGEIVGVSDENRIRQAGVLDLLANCVFAGDNTPEVRVDTLRMDGKKVDVLTVINSFSVPFYLKSKSKKYNSIREGYIYTRVADRNTPISQNATIQQIEMLWKKRFGLNQPPLEQIMNRLGNRLEWVETEDTYYNLYKPEFKLVEESSDNQYDKSKAEFYVYSQTNSSFMYTNLKIMVNSTILKEFQLVVLDSGRYKTPVPDWGYAGYDEWGVNHKFTYKYFLLDSLDYKLQQFFFNSENTEKAYAKRKFDDVVLYFENNEERLAFEFYVENKQKVIEQYIIEADKVYYSIEAENGRVKRVERHRLSTGLALNRLLQEFRTVNEGLL